MQYGLILCDLALCIEIQYSIVWFEESSGMVRYGVAWYSIVWYGLGSPLGWYGALQYGMVWGVCGGERGVLTAWFNLLPASPFLELIKGSAFYC